MLGQIEAKDRVVIADMEAGIGTLTRMREGALDLILLVANPSAKSLEVVRRAGEIITQAKVAPRSLVVANRVRDEVDLELLRTALHDAKPTVVPEDAEVRRADILGASPADSVPVPPAVQALDALARSLRI